MSSKFKLIPGRYTKGPLAGEVRYLDPTNGRLYNDAAGVEHANSGFTRRGRGVWSDYFCFEFTEDTLHTKPEPYGYLVCSPNWPAKVLHRTREGAEKEALRLAKGNVAVEFTVVPVYPGDPVAKAYTPKPKPTLERL